MAVITLPNPAENARGDRSPADGQRWTAEEVIALGLDKDREVIRGELRERGMTMRNRRHSRTSTQAAFVLEAWRSRTHSVGEVLTGDAAFRLKRNPDTAVGVDVAYVDRPVPEDVFMIEGAPTLAVEIKSNSDTQADIHDKIGLYLAAGTKAVWYVEPIRKKVFVYHPDGTDEVLSESDTLTAEPHLPGFSVKVAELFI